MTFNARRLPSDDVNDLAAAVEDEFKRVSLALQEIYAESIFLRARSIEPKRIDGLTVHCIGGVIWNGQNLNTKGWYTWNAAAQGGAGRWERV